MTAGTGLVSAASMSDFLDENNVDGRSGSSRRTIEIVDFRQGIARKLKAALSPEMCSSEP